MIDRAMQSNTEPTIGVGSPPPDLYRMADIRTVQNAVEKLTTEVNSLGKDVVRLQAKHENVEDELKGVRTDVKEARDRLAVIEERVRHLPSKGFIWTVVTGALAVGTALVTIAPKLQQWAGMSPPIAAASPSVAPATPAPPPQPGSKR